MTPATTDIARIAILTTFSLAALVATPIQAAQWTTQLGGSRNSQPRDIAIDRTGNHYVVGGTEAPDFPRTIGPAHAGSYDVFVTKLDSNGEVIWSRLLGGPRYDRAYAVEVDQNGFIYVAGRAGPGYPVSRGVLQAEFGGDAVPNGTYGRQDGFVTKLSPDGGDIVWSTYFGGADRGVIRDIDIDTDGNVYAAATENLFANPHVTAGAFMTHQPSSHFGIVAKLSADGTRVIWATYLGGLDGKSSFATPSIRVGEDRSVTVSGSTASTDVPTTPGAFDRSQNGETDIYVARFRADGSSLEFATYLGGKEKEYGDTHNLVLAADGAAIVAAQTESRDFPVNPEGFQAKHRGNGGSFNQTGDGFIVHFSRDGTRILASTLFGGNSGDGIEGVALDATGNVYISGGTFSTDLPGVAGGPGQSVPTQTRRVPDLFAASFSPDLKRLRSARIFSGAHWDLGLACAVDGVDSWVLTGQTTSADFPGVRPQPGRGIKPADAAPTTKPATKTAVVLRFTPDE